MISMSPSVDCCTDGDVRILPRMSSVRSGFFFCGMALEPVEKASGRSIKPNSAVAWRVISSAKRRDVQAERGASLGEVEEEVAVCWLRRWSWGWGR